MIGHIELTDSDLENILLWHNRAFNQKNDYSKSDRKTLIKLQAMLIVEQEDHDKFSKFGGAW